MRSMVEGRRHSRLFFTLREKKKGSLRSRPSTTLRAVPLPSKTRGGLFPRPSPPNVTIRPYLLWATPGTFPRPHRFC